MKDIRTAASGKFAPKSGSKYGDNWRDNISGKSLVPKSRSNDMRDRLMGPWDQPKVQRKNFGAKFKIKQCKKEDPQEDTLHSQLLPKFFPGSLFDHMIKI